MFSYLIRFLELNNIVDHFVIGITTHGFKKGRQRTWNPWEMVERISSIAKVNSKVTIINITYDFLNSTEFYASLTEADRVEIEEEGA